MPRYILGPTIGELNYEVLPPLPGEARARADQLAKFVEIEARAGAVVFDVEPFDPEAHNRMTGLLVFYVPQGHGLPQTADQFVAGEYPRSRVEPPESGHVAVPKPAEVERGTPYVGQAVFEYAE